MCSAPMLVASSEAPTTGQTRRRPARKNSSLLPFCLAHRQPQTEQDICDQRGAADDPI